MDVISMRDFTREQILAILNVTDDVKKAVHDDNFNTSIFKEKYGCLVTNLLDGVKIATMFLENSTRTNHSFRAATMLAGGKFDGFPSKDYTSLKKGETWADTTAMFAGYGYNALIMRSTTEGLAHWTKEFLEQNHQLLVNQHNKLNSQFSYHVPMIINAGDGRNQHPTQCFLDLFTMMEIARAHGKTLDNLDLALLNDLKHGRTNASLMSIAHLFNFKLHFAYPNRFGPQQHRLDSLKRRGVQIFDYGENFKKAMGSSFVAYHSRPQKERVGKGEDLISIKELGQINRKLYNSLGEQAPYLMHPLPVDAETFEEISADMRDHPLNMTKLQSSNGLYVRIALLAIGLGKIKLNFLDKTIEPQSMSMKYFPKPEFSKNRDENSRSGYIENDGVVIDHLEAGMGRRVAGILGLELRSVPKVISDFMPVLHGRKPVKDMIKIHCNYELSREQLEAIALISPNTTINIIQHGQVYQKFTPVLGSSVLGRVKCGNKACVTNVKKEQIIPKHHLEEIGGERVLRCHYCEYTDTIPEVYEDNRFIYIGEEK